MFTHHSSISDDLFAIADSFNLSLLYPINQVSTRYLDNTSDSNLVINLMFLHCDFSKLNMHSIYPEWRLMSDYVPLTIIISIAEEHIATQRRTITKNSEKEDKSNIVGHTWMKYSKLTNIMKHSKSWWNEDCNRDLATYRSSKSIESWKMF